MNCTENYKPISIESKMPELRKCTRCRCNKMLSYFDANKNSGLLKKTCRKCLEKQKKRNTCPHGRRKSQCKECDGSEICEHNRRRSICKECGGSQICEHNRERRQCKDCMNDEQKIEYIQKQMISHSRQSDKKKDLYDPDNFIDKCFLEGLFEDSQKCHYCDVDFTYNKRCDTFVTIERLNNTIGHIKSNCVLACFHCNNRHKSKVNNKD